MLRLLPDLLGHIKSTTSMQFFTLIFALAAATSGGLSASAAPVVTIKCKGTGTVGGFGVGSISESPKGVFYAPGDTPGVTYTSAALACQDACNGQLGWLALEHHTNSAVLVSGVLLEATL